MRYLKQQENITTNIREPEPTAKAQTLNNRGLGFYIPVLCARLQICYCELRLCGGQFDRVNGHVPTRYLNVVGSDRFSVALRSGPCHQQGRGTTADLSKYYQCMYLYSCLCYNSQPLCRNCYMRIYTCRQLCASLCRLCTTTRVTCITG